MSLTLIKYTDKYSDAWEQFVHQSNNGTIFHERKFLGYHPADRFIDHSLLFFQKGKLIGLMSGVSYKENGILTLHSHKGASFGGLIYNEDVSIQKSFALVKSLVSYAREQNIKRIILTIPPIIYNRRLTNYIEFALIKNHFRYLKREVSSILFLEDSLESNIDKFKPANRRACKRAEQSGIKVRITDDFENFYGVLEKNLSIRHGVKPTHTLEELKKIHMLYPERVILYGAFLKELMIAGIVVFHTNPRVTLAFYISHDEKYQNYRAVNLLFREVIRESIENGFQYLDFGIFTVNMEPNFGLGRFKESFGASGVFRDTFIYEF
jgi:hypothetical protein